MHPIAARSNDAQMATSCVGLAPAWGLESSPSGQSSPWVTGAAGLPGLGSLLASRGRPHWAQPKEIYFWRHVLWTIMSKTASHMGLACAAGSA